MNIFIIILLILAGIIVSMFLLALFMRKKHYVKREVIINAPRKKVFDYIKLLKNQDGFNKNAQAGSERKKEFKGIDGTVGYTYAWSGDKSAGMGEKEIKNIVEGKSIETEIRFIKPMKVSATIIMETEFLPGDQTKVSWSNGGKLPYPFNLLIPMMEKHVKRDMAISLMNLKDILEKQ